MNARKNYNSIVFLTVYLGLALVGASPQVLAQAATARQFDVKTEIEFKDDLDNKPDGEQALADYSVVLQDLYSLTKEFADANSDKLRGADYEFDCAVDVYPNTSKKYFCPGGSGLYSNIFFPALNRINEIFPHTDDREKEQVRVNIILSGDSFLVKITLNQDYERQAGQFHNYYKSALSAPKLKRTDNLKAVVYESTSVSFENNQVFIVTRLPRASIEPLIADKNAQ
jgi:hypothetical protein